MPQNRPRMSPITAIMGLLGFRGRRIAHTGAWSLIAKLCAAANLFVSVPYVVGAIGLEQFGAWATLVSLVTFAGFLDFGFGNGTMNLVASAHGRKAAAEVATILHASRRALLFVALLLALVFLVILPLVPWDRVLGMPESASAMSRAAVATVLFSIVFAVPLNLANRIQLGLGRGERAFRWQAVGQLVTLAVVIACARSNASLAVLTGAAVATPLLASIANNYSLWRDSSISTHLSASVSERASMERRIRREGSLFFILQLAAALAFSADLLLISALLGSSEAGTYAIVQRLFSLIPLALSLIWAPLWPIYRQSLAAGDRRWVMKTLSVSLLFAVLFSTISASVLAIGFDRLTSIWIATPLTVSGLLLGGFVLWSIVEAIGTAAATFLNAASVMRFQVITASIFALTCFSGKAWVIANVGFDWIPWVTATTYSLASLLPLIWFGRRILADVFSRQY